MSKSKKQQAQTAEIKALLQGVQAAKPGATPAPVKPEPVKREPVKREHVDASLHTLAMGMLKAEAGYDKATNAVYMAFKTYAVTALPIIARMPAHVAALEDIRAVFGEARKPAAIQRVTMLNNLRTIAHGKEATRDTPAQAAQGVQAALDALEACTSLPALKQALVALKTVTHASTGKPKLPNPAKEESTKPVTTIKPMKADDMVMPGTQAEAIKAACRLLEFVSRTFLSAGSDAELVLEVDDVVAKLKAKAA